MNMQLSDFINKKMSRKDFLKHVAIGAVAVASGSALLRLMTTFNKQSTSSTSTSTNSNPSPLTGYGAMPYGGRLPEKTNH